MALSVSQIMLSTGFGGAERLFVDLCLALADRGVRVQAICQPTFEGRRLLLGDERIELAEIEVKGNWDPFATRRLRRQIAGFRPRVIHSHLARGALYAGRVARSLSIPLIANLHNYVDLKYYRHVDLFLPGTADQARYLRERGIAVGAIEVIPHFTRLPCAETAAAQGRSFVSYGRMVAKKGFDVLLRAFAQVIERSADARLLLGGDGPERAVLDRLAKTLGIAAAVEFTGWIDDAGAFLDRGDIFVLPSLDEPFGIVILEAMARGKAIIASRTAGPLEVLDESMACLVGVGDEAGLARAMSRLYDDDEGRRLLAERSLGHFREHYSESRVLPAFIKAYRSLDTTPLSASGRPA